MLQVLLPGPVLSSVLPGQRASLQRPHLDVPIQDVQQSGELADQRVPLSHAHLPDRHQQLQLHLLAPAGLCRETPPASAAAGQRWGVRGDSAHLAAPPRWRQRCWSGPERRSPAAGTGRSPGPGCSGRGWAGGPRRTGCPGSTRGSATPEPGPAHLHLTSPNPGGWTLPVPHPQVVDLGLVAVGYGAAQHQGVVGQGEGVASASVGDGWRSCGGGGGRGGEIQVIQVVTG